MTPEETLDWLAQQHFDQCREERPIQDWIRKMKSQLPAQPEQEPVKNFQVCEIGARFDGAAQQHIPFVVIEFEPVPVNSEYDAKGWKDRDLFISDIKNTTPQRKPLTDADRFCDANCTWSDHHPDCKYGKPEQEQEPDWYHVIDVHGCNRFYHKTEDCPYELKTPFYTTSPQRTWVGLTDEEVDECFSRDPMVAARNAEAKLKEKNTRNGGCL